MSIFQTIRNLGKIVARRKSLNFTLPTCKCASKRNLSDGTTNFVSFDEIVQRRRAEAKRSIVVQVNSEKSYSELHGYCSKYADIKGMHHYKNMNDEHFILIEFTTEENLKDVIKACGSHQKDLDVMALQSPFLWFRAAPDKKQKYPVAEGVSLVTENADMEVNNDELYESLMTCNTVSEQIQMLYDKTALNDIGVRLRYIVARQIESLFESMYTNIAVMPFGSTVNGFGKLGCDLDLVLTNTVTEEMCDPAKRLVFVEKQCGGGLRPWARHMELVGAALELRAAGAARVARVPHARVPIVQCTHHIADLDVDICYNNTSGVYMSELLWTLGSLDARVRPLVFAVRRWAQTVGLTNPHPGRWITNFPLTLLVLHFLQHETKDGFVLPAVKQLVQNAGAADVRIAEDHVNCTFLRSAPPPRECHSQSDASLETLLLQFFEYYAQFDFQERAVSVYEGAGVRKPSSQPLYIINPLEPALNVSKNVSYDECERLKSEVRNAAWQLEGAENQRSGREGWGLLALVERTASRGLKRLLRAGNSHRLLQVEDLFKEDETPVKEGQEGLSEKLKRLARKSGKTQKPIRDEQTHKPTEGAKEKKEVFKFKNSQVAAEVFRIRRNKIV